MTKDEVQCSFTKKWFLVLRPLKSNSRVGGCEEVSWTGSDKKINGVEGWGGCGPREIKTQDILKTMTTRKISYECYLHDISSKEKNIKVQRHQLIKLKLKLHAFLAISNAVFQLSIFTTFFIGVAGLFNESRLKYCLPSRNLLAQSYQ